MKPLVEKVYFKVNVSETLIDNPIAGGGPGGDVLLLSLWQDANKHIAANTISAMYKRAAFIHKCSVSI